MFALISGSTILLGTTRRSRIPTSVKMPTLTFAAMADTQSPMGTKFKNTMTAMITNTSMNPEPNNNSKIFSSLTQFRVKC